MERPRAAEPRLDYAAALDEYLHVIVRTRHWSKRAEEEALTAFGGWLEAETGEAPGLSAALEARVDGYAAAAGLGDEARAALEEALARFLGWAADTGVMR
jgi:hypothetical protein